MTHLSERISPQYEGFQERGTPRYRSMATRGLARELSHGQGVWGTLQVMVAKADFQALSFSVG